MNRSELFKNLLATFTGEGSTLRFTICVSIFTAFAYEMAKMLNVKVSLNDGAVNITSMTNPPLYEDNATNVETNTNFHDDENISES